MPYGELPVSDRHARRQLTAALFLDTNVLLHFRSLREIDWLAAAGAKAVRLVLCSTVLDELDEKKNEARTTERAKLAISELKQIESDHGRVRDGVTLEPILDDNAASKNRDADIIRSAQDFSKQHPSERVSIVSDDYAMGLRCRTRGVACLTLDEQWRKPLEDDAAQKLRRTQQELQRVQNRLPDLALLASLGKSGEPLQILDVPIIPPDALDIEKALTELQKSHPKMSVTEKMAMLAEGIAGAEVDKYNAELDSYYQEYRKYLQSLAAHGNAKALTLELSFWITNRGTSPANDVRATLQLPDDLPFVFDKQKVDDYFNAMARRMDRTIEFLFKKPRPPSAPKRPEPEKYLGTLGYIPGLRAHERIALGYERMIKSKASEMDFLRSLKVEGHTVRLWAKKIRHKDSECIGTVFVAWDGWNKISPLEVTYEINTDDHPDGFTGRLLIRPKLPEPTSGGNATGQDATATDEASGVEGNA
jgi:rRNA-processing protein FCF1